MVALLAVAAVALAAEPQVTTGPATDVTGTTATLTGTVNPGKEATTYFFEYGTTTAYGSRTAIGSAGGGKANRKVRADIAGLAPSTVYHYRLVARNGSGTTNGADATFTTTEDRLSVAASPNPVVFGRGTTISGRLRGPSNGGVTVDLQGNPYPFTGGFETAATSVTASNGNYSFSRVPLANTRYRVIARTSPPTTSAELLVLVRIRVSLRLSDSTPRRGQRVRFSGFARPAHDGRRVYIQRRTSTGSYRTIARTLLVDDGASRSRFTRRIRIDSDGVFRARVRRDADHATGTSSKRRALVH